MAAPHPRPCAAPLFLKSSGSEVARAPPRLDLGVADAPLSRGGRGLAEAEGVRERVGGRADSSAAGLGSVAALEEGVGGGAVVLGALGVVGGLVSPPMPFSHRNK